MESSEPDLRAYALGYSASAHAAKLPAWRARLDGAAAQLRTTAAAGDRAETLRLLGDVWFWIGRLAGELMAAAVDPTHAAAAKRAADSITSAYTSVYQATAVLAADDLPQPSTRTDALEPVADEDVGGWGSPWRDRLPGGLADRRLPSQFDPVQLRRGTRVEREHTSDPHIAREIAMDHLTEHRGYYPALALMERALSRKARASTRPVARARVRVRRRRL